MLKLLCADIAQLVEQLIRNEQVKGSSPFIGCYLEECYERRTVIIN